MSLHYLWGYPQREAPSLGTEIADVCTAASILLIIKASCMSANTQREKHTYYCSSDWSRLTHRPKVGVPELILGQYRFCLSRQCQLSGEDDHSREKGFPFSLIPYAISRGMARLSHGTATPIDWNLHSRDWSLKSTFQRLLSHN